MMLSRCFLLFALAFEVTSTGNVVSALVQSNSTFDLAGESEQEVIPTRKTPFPTVAPPTTEAPTESPAPSPSPSVAPTATPTKSPKPTGKPTSAPTESPAPSPSPSVSPTLKPTISHSPSASPTTSPQPSASPSASPTASPSSAPSKSPTKAPTISSAPSSSPTDRPSKSPTQTPSSSPTKTPTQSPSAAPSSSPTEESFKTKTSITTLVLPELEREMSDSHIIEFEIVTMEFIRDTVPHTEGYEIQILASTLLSQTAFVPEEEEDATEGDAESDQEERRLTTTTPTPKASLEVTFQTVGVVVTGGAPVGFNFTTDIVSVGFDNHMEEYLYRLSKVNDYFKPLRAHTTYREALAATKGGQFVAAVLFSVIAFIVAIFASIFAIRRHLAVKRRRRRRKKRLSYMPKSQTFSSSHGSTEEEESNDEMPLQLEIQNDRMQFENVPITPRSIASPFKDEETYPLSPRMESSTHSTNLFGETAGSLRRWLTPRLSSGGPQNSPDPIAAKMGTFDGGKATGKTPLSIPLSFFNQGADSQSEASGTPMGSLAESAASSFFNRMGRSVFTGGRKSYENYHKARSKFSPPSQPVDRYQTKFQPTIKEGRNPTKFVPQTKIEPRKSIDSEDESAAQHRTFDGRPSAASEVSDVMLNDMGTQMKDNMTKYYESSTLGARALHNYEDSSLSSVRKKPESYDVFAPSGPIGIVVDTSKNGPTVHSLKSTSPMLGLINPGDLIIGLDDEDTRKMTAATLTRLMAKKSRQTERKITLLSADGF